MAPAAEDGMRRARQIAPIVSHLVAAPSEVAMSFARLRSALPSLALALLAVVLPRPAAGQG